MYIISALESSTISKLSLAEKLKSFDSELYKTYKSMSLDYAPNRMKSIIRKMKQCSGPFIPVVITIANIIAGLLDSKQDNYQLGQYDFQTRELIGDIIKIIVLAQKNTYDFSSISDTEISLFASSILGLQLLNEDEKSIKIKLAPVKSQKMFSKLVSLPRFKNDQLSTIITPRSNLDNPLTERVTRPKDEIPSPRLGGLSRTPTSKKLRKSTNLLPRSTVQINENLPLIYSLPSNEHVSFHLPEQQQTPQSPRIRQEEKKPSQPLISIPQFFGKHNSKKS